MIRANSSPAGAFGGSSWGFSDEGDKKAARTLPLEGTGSDGRGEAAKPATLYGLLWRKLFTESNAAAPNCAMAVALARLFCMERGINPMTDGTKPRTLKDQLESETAATERSAAEDSERYHGGDWWQLTDEEESVFVIDRERFPRMITVWSCYEAFKNIAYSLSWDEGLIEQACQQHPDWCSAGISDSEFSDFANAFGGLTHREAHTFYTKHDFWCVRADVRQYHRVETRILPENGSSGEDLRARRGL